jgi:hypothetical protein
MAILGLLDTEKFASQRFTNIRRSVFYFYPNGAAPLMGMLSLLKEEDTNDPRFSWWEKRLATQRSLSIANTTGMYITTLGAPGSDAANPFVPADGAVIRIAVADSTIYRVGHQIKITGSPLSGGGTIDVFGTVTNLYSSAAPGYIDIKLNGAPGSLANTAATVGLEVWVVGNSFAQGITNTSSDIWNIPVNIENFTQIYRTPFSFTGTALKTAAKFDETGPYMDKSKENSVYHMIEMEKSMIFGRKKLDTSGTTPQYYTGGILYWLQQWELTANNPWGASGATLDSDDNKRIISNASGVLSEKTYDGYLERVFRVTNNKANEKLVLCGSGFLKVINQMYRSKTTIQARQGDKTTYGMTVVQHDTSFGTIYYKSHPLFSQNPIMRYNALFVDVQNLLYRYMQGRDTELLTNRQPNDADYRLDEWFTEAGLEFRFPESHMYLQNVQDYAP